MEDAENQLDREGDKKEVLICANNTRSILKMVRCRKHRWLGYVLRHKTLLHDIIEGKMLDKAAWGKKRMELLHDMMEERETMDS